MTQQRLLLRCASKAALAAATAALALAAAGSASAQTRGFSVLPGTQNGYVGINVGKPDFGDVGCGSAAFPCDDPDARFHVYTGGLVGGIFGAEVGYVYEGRGDRGNGDVRAEGVNLSVVARAPFGAFNAFAKAGALYGRVRVSADPLSGVPTGSRRGWGGALSAGVGWDITPTSGLVLEWSRNQFRFPGVGGRTDIDATSLGYVHRF